MVKLRVSRKARFESALRLVGLNQASWAAANRVPRTYLNEFLNNKRVSAPLAQKIDAFCAKVEGAELIHVDGAA